MPQRPNIRRAEQQAKAHPILTLLNGDINAASRKRLTEILLDIQKLDSICATLRGDKVEEVVRVRRSRPMTARGILLHAKALKRERDSILDRVNGHLSKTRQFHRLEFFHFDTDLILRAEFHARSESARKVEEAIYFLLRYQLAGEIGKFRTCGECATWFFAVTDHQKYCSAKCRSSRISRSERFKEKRRQYMKRYREGYKKPN